MLEVKLKGVANEDLVQGYPGVPATWPRIAGTLEIRTLPYSREPAGRTPVHIASVTVGLFRTDLIVVPSHRPSAVAQKREKSFLVTRQKEIFRSKTSAKVFALDVPFTLSLLTTKAPTASISLAKLLESQYNVYVGVEYTYPATLSLQTENFQFPVRVKRFDTLRTFGTYKQPLAGEQPSTDHLISLEWSLPVSAYGPGDKILISLQVQPNHDWPKSKKVKLKRFSVELVQKTRYIVDKPSDANAQSQPLNGSMSSSNKEEDTIETRTRVIKAAKDFTSAEQEARQGILDVQNLELGVPTTLQSEERGSILPKEQPWVGYDGRSAFTNASSLYSIDFVLVIKARFSHAKDIEAEQPITLSQFDHAACATYMNSLVESAQRLKHLNLRTHSPRVWTEPLDTKIRIA